MEADIVSIGNEVATGAVANTNAAWLARRLTDLGVRVRRHVTVADELDAMQAEIERSIAAVDTVIMTGGLGPTPDDLARPALAAAIRQPLDHNDACADHVRSMFERMGRPMAEMNLQQALVPRTAVPLENPWGTAPGIRARVGDTVIYALPGVPREMRNMFDRHIEPDVRGRPSGDVVVSRVVHTFGEGESAVSQQILDLMRPGRNPAVGTQASEGLISVRILARAESEEQARRMADADGARVRSVLGPLVFGEGADTLPSVLGRMLRERGQTLATAESCTGGLIAQSLTDVPGSSAYFLRGYVPYSNDAKTELLGVPPSMLAAHGAVSKPVAEAMATGCLAAAGADYALSVTGIAGPTGGTKDKPIGLVFIGLAERGGCLARRFQFSSHLDRAAIRDRTSKTALNMLRLRLLA